MQDSNEKHAQRCKATTSKGNRCGAYAIEGGLYCFMHSPDHAQARTQARRRGAANKPPPANAPFPETDISTQRGLSKFLSELIRDTWNLPPSVHRARTLASLIQLQKELIPTAKLEARNAEYEAKRSTPPHLTP